MKNKNAKLYLIGAYFLVILISFIANFEPGKVIAINFKNFAISMIKVLPCAFILIGLFEVWVKRETVEKHFGESSGLMGYIWAIILSSTTVGGAYVAFPIAHSLMKKGARLSVILTFVGSASITRIPMTIFEATFLGVKFSIIRIIVSLPLIVISSIFIEKLYGSSKLIVNESIED